MPQPCDQCGKLPVWFGHELGRYQCDHGNAGWRVTAGPIPEPEARAQWDRMFGVAP